MNIRRLVPEDAASFQALRLQALHECPAAFGSSYEEECETPITVIAGHLTAGSGRNLFGAFNGSQLVGTIGVGRESARKLSHKGFIRGMYVAPAFRHRGIGRQLLKQALEFAVSMPGLRQVTLVVNAGNTSAIALYQSLGFRSFGVEPEALLIDGVPHDEMHMVRRVQPAT